MNSRIRSPLTPNAYIFHIWIWQRRLEQNVFTNGKKFDDLITNKIDSNALDGFEYLNYESFSFE